jgi:hypothetical protein
MRKFPSKLTKANTIDKDTNLLHLQGFQQFLPTILRYLDDKSLFEFHLTCKELRLRIRGEPTWRNRIVNRINISENNALQAAVNLGVSPSIAKDLKLEEKSVEELEKFEPIRRQVWLRTLYRLEHFFDDDKAEHDDGEDGEGEDDDGKDDDGEDEEANDDNDDGEDDDKEAEDDDKEDEEDEFDEREDEEADDDNDDREDEEAEDEEAQAKNDEQ